MANTKSIFSSLTVNSGIVVAICAVIAAFSKSLSQEELLGTFAAGQGSIASILAIGTSIMAVVTRVKATNFKVPAMKSKVFWYGLATMLTTGFSLFGGDIKPEELTGIVDSIFTAAPEAVAFLASIGIIWGRFKADTPLVVKKAVKK